MIKRKIKDLKNTVLEWSQKFARIASFGPGILKTILLNLYFWYLLQKTSLQDSNAKTSQCHCQNLGPHYKSNSSPALFYVLVLKLLDILKHDSIVCQHSDFYFSISLVRFQVVSGLGCSTIWYNGIL